MASTRGRMIRREDVLAGTMEAHVRDAARRYDIPFRAPAERLRIMRAMLAELPAGEDPWVFGYGSLIWNPAFDHVEIRRGRVFGYHRRFAFWSRMGRGSPEAPGLMLGLVRGGSCGGLVFRVASDKAGDELKSVFLREMMTSSYHARFVPAHTEAGPVRAIAFVANPDHAFYAGRVPLETAARHIAVAEGRLGPCRDYLYNTVAHLDARGIRDRDMRELLRLVRGYRAALAGGA